MLKEAIKEVERALREEDVDTLRYYRDFFSLFSSGSVSAEVAIRLILGKIAREEGKRPVYGVVVPDVELSSSAVYEDLRRLNRKLYAECLDVRKNRNFLVCLLSKLNKSQYSGVITFLQNYYGYEHVWLTDLLAD